MPRFETYTDRAGRQRWRLIADNGQIVATSSQGYASRSGLDRSIEIVREGSANTEVYQDKAGEFRWRMVASNGNIIATAGEGYTIQANAEQGLDRTQTLAKGADVVRLQVA